MRSFTPEPLVLVELAELYFEKAECGVIFRKGVMKEEVLSEATNRDYLKATLRQSLPDTCSSRKITVRDLFYQLVGTTD